jgi:hypothetical protein
VSIITADDAVAPLVVSPLRTVVEREGIEVLLLSIEVWRDEVFVRARGLPSQRTVVLEREFSEASDVASDRGTVDLRPFPYEPPVATKPCRYEHTRAEFALVE